MKHEILRSSGWAASLLKLWMSTSRRRNPLCQVSSLCETLWAIRLPLIPKHLLSVFITTSLTPPSPPLPPPSVPIPSAMNMDRFEKGPREILNPEIQKVRASTCSWWNVYTRPFHAKSAQQHRNYMGASGCVICTCSASQWRLEQ